ncbi:MAG TPA: GNAT family N-acetyltransferase [Bacteroidales bacterium]|nr:GNAT family N-acetyltransferase [Bacteroidales bacterium]
MNFKIRQADEKDFPAILMMIKELAEFEKASEKVTNSVEQMKKEKDLFRCFVAASEDGEILGMALYFLAYYTWVGKSLYLDDIYIRKEFRRNGIGSALLGKIFEVARNEECKRVRWQVLDWNKDAIQLYRKCGAVLDGEWMNCDFDSEAILNFML